MLGVSASGSRSSVLSVAQWPLQGGERDFKKVENGQRVGSFKYRTWGTVSLEAHTNSRPPTTPGKPPGFRPAHPSLRTCFHWHCAQPVTQAERHRVPSNPLYAVTQPARKRCDLRLSMSPRSKVKSGGSMRGKAHQVM